MCLITQEMIEDVNSASATCTLLYVFTLQLGNNNSTTKTPVATELQQYYQAAFCVGFPGDLRRGFPNRSAYWRAIVVFGVKRHKTEPAQRRRV